MTDDEKEALLSRVDDGLALLDIIPAYCNVAAVRTDARIDACSGDIVGVDGVRVGISVPVYGCIASGTPITDDVLEGSFGPRLADVLAFTLRHDHRAIRARAEKYRMLPLIAEGGSWRIVPWKEKL